MSSGPAGSDAHRWPVSTYRLQLHAGFGFAAAAQVVPYLARLGVSHLYLSPVLQAAPGSQHGYDVVDHDQVSADLGGEQGLVRLSEVAHEHGLGIMVDVVPNHMAIAAPEYLNRPLWQVLRDGRAAATAHWFDVDWDHNGGRFGLPLLGRSLTDTLVAGELTLGDHEGAPVICYYEHVFPVAPGTEGEDVAEVLSRQHYLLANWREKDDVLAYRRFFDIDTLVAVRVEDDDVFDASHRLLVDLHRRGVVDGFRIDHPDGLADPAGYLRRLRDATGGAWVVVEKILEGEESLPADWACAGSTGYDAVRAVQQALLPPTGEALETVWSDVVGSHTDLADVERRAKQEVVSGVLQPEVRRLTRVAVQAAADAGAQLRGGAAAEALGELLVQMDAYRAYVQPGEPVDAAAAERLGGAVERAHLARPDLTAELVLLERLLLDTATDGAAGRDLIVRFQQTCGPVMAKGVEDTTFYRWHEFVALDEVGGDPAVLDDPSVSALHAWAERQVDRHPMGMTTLSTHDTKRSEDVRARLLAAAGDPPAWRRAWEPVRATADRLGVDRPTAYLLLQTLVGTWPIEGERLAEYLVKAIREAKRRTTWIDPAQDYEDRVLELARAVADDPELRAGITGLLDASASAIRATTLGAKLLQLTLPGVADVYQGCETVELSLVDPDNRRPVDYVSLADRLGRLDAGAAPDGLGDEKLLVTSRALRLRARAARLFTGPDASYQPLHGTGPQLIGYVRGGGAIVLATRWPTRLAAAGGWGAATVRLPEGSWVDELTGQVVGGGVQPVGAILSALPVALLVGDR
ncbi:MAG TPA: malto-oligosyltrehalose synthase [Nocardioidaceae bacterium]|nr:malto-oligosyltrehalose synthase [Nocardioidaceae bacterium]